MKKKILAVLGLVGLGFLASLMGCSGAEEDQKIVGPASGESLERAAPAESTTEAEVSSVEQSLTNSRPDHVATITVGTGSWGTWASTFDYCDYVPGYSITYAYIAYLQSEPAQGSSDDTALNAVKLGCACWEGANCSSSLPHFTSGGFNPLFHWTNTNPTSSTSPWGTYGWATMCNSGYATGAKMQIEPSQGSNDDTGANDVSLMDASGTFMTSQVNTHWGNWTSPVACPAGTAICGLRTRVEGRQGSGDDTALNGVQFACCTHP